MFSSKGHKLLGYTQICTLIGKDSHILIGKTSQSPIREHYNQEDRQSPTREQTSIEKTYSLQL